MSSNLQELLREALLNNTYDYDVVHNTLSTTWKNSYSYLYTLQKSFIEYEEFFYFSNDEDSRNSKYIGHLYLDKQINATFDIDYDLIHVMNREEFRTSQYYQTRFTIYDMVYNPDIFLKIPIVIIDDKVIWDYELQIKKDTATFTLPFKRQFVIKDERKDSNDDITYIDHKIQVLVVDNIYYTRYKVNKNNLEYNPSTGLLKINKNMANNYVVNEITNITLNEFLKKYKVKAIYNLNSDQQYEYQTELNRRIKEISRTPDKDKTGVTMMSIHFPNDVDRGYELGSSLLPMTEDDNYYYVTLTGNLKEKFNNHRLNMYLSLVYINKLRKHIYYNGLDYNTAVNNKANLLVLEEEKGIPYKSPIPVENFMVFKRDDINSDITLIKNTEALSLHYPNIYRIDDKEISNNNVYEIFYFYHEMSDYKYTVMFDFYFKFLSVKFSDKSLEEILNDIYFNRADLSSYTQEQKDNFALVFKAIMDYKYYVYKYGETDFLNRYQMIPGNQTKTPVEYKIETLREWMKQDQWLLRDYVLEQNKIGDSYHLFANTLDLGERIRTDTSSELGYTFVFDKPQYVFAFANNRLTGLLDCRIFVDGILIGDVYHDNKLFKDFFYVPTDMVRADSYIELEVFPRYQFIQPVEFSSMDDEKTIILNEPEEKIFPTAADLYYIDNDANRYAGNTCDITSCYTEGEYKVKTVDRDKPVKFTRLKKFKIKPTIPEILNKEVNVTINKCSNIIRFITERDGYPFIEIADTNFNFDTHYLRVFIDGRLISRNRYRLMTTVKKARMMFFDWLPKGTLIYIDITPYRYEEIYYKEELTPDDLLLDLRNIITKPFNISYYDVYINGRKMSLNSVMSITPWEITFVNLKSNYNLIIYERDRDWEYFGLNYKTNDYYLTLDHLFEKDLIDEEEKKKLLKEIIDDVKHKDLIINPNTNDEEKMDYTYDPDNQKEIIFHIFYFDELIPKTFYDGDVFQTTEEIMKDTYREVYEQYIVNVSSETSDPVAKNRRYQYHDALLLDPDIIVSGVNDNNSIIVYEIGHSGDISEDMLNQEVVIPKPEEGNIE